ncbi:MAG: four helix bundle protein [Verrucomicrobiales bacterium]|nr:four helix bundle protein [Verrucomicrobiales bacterium]
MSKFRPSGGYRTTCSFQTATIIYDATYWFCEKFLDARSRTVDQMIQAARSGRQNIAEGSRAAATSSQTELRLLNVARSSLEELLLDYEDFLRHGHLAQWTSDSAEALAVRQVPRRFRTDSSDLTDLTDQERWALYAPWLEHANSAVRANAAICLIHQATTCSTSRSPPLKRPLSRTAATASNLPPPAWPSARKGKVRPLSPIPQIAFPFAQSVPNPWFYASPEPARIPANSSGAAPPTPTAKQS